MVYSYIRTIKLIMTVIELYKN